ncbi:MAG: hypothetical protein AAFV29_07560, partial [Myxococcota bacterium]
MRAWAAALALCNLASEKRRPGGEALKGTAPPSIKPDRREAPWALHNRVSEREPSLHLFSRSASASALAEAPHPVGHLFLLPKPSSNNNRLSCNNSNQQHCCNNPR